MSRNLEYEANNRGYNWEYNQEGMGGIKCKNYIICNSLLPEYWYNCKGHYECDICFNLKIERLTQIENIECPICLEIKKVISQPNCDHNLCIDCFRRCYYGPDNDGPKFPYSEEIEKEYETYLKNEILNEKKWENEYPLIEKYNQELLQWGYNMERQYSNEENLRKCPLCRK